MTSSILSTGPDGLDFKSTICNDGLDTLFSDSTSQHMQELRSNFAIRSSFDDCLDTFLQYSLLTTDQNYTLLPSRTYHETDITPRCFNEKFKLSMLSVIYRQA